jgi:hypothetical protein
MRLVMARVVTVMARVMVRATVMVMVTVMVTVMVIAVDTYSGSTLEKGSVCRHLLLASLCV